MIDRKDLTIEKRLEMLEGETRELYARLHERDKAFERIRQAYIGIRPGERDERS